MGMVGAFLFGYWMGTRAGQEGMNKLRHAAFVVLQSEEFKSTVTGVSEMARGVLKQGIETARAA
jgi:hypothetical protein